MLRMRDTNKARIGNICQNVRQNSNAVHRALYICKKVSQRMMNLPLAFSSSFSSPPLNIRSKNFNRFFRRSTVLSGKRLFSVSGYSKPV